MPKAMPRVTDAMLDTIPDGVGSFDDTAVGEPLEALFAGRFVIESLLGAGGMGSVYRAHDRKLDEVVALKVIRPELVRPEMIEHFQREVKLARRVTHRNVVRVFDLGEHDGLSFFTMELVPGDSLAKVLAERGRIPAAMAWTIARELSAALDAAHTAGVVHRDLKPDNVIVAHDGRFVITDFGIASPPETHAAAGGPKFFGTPAYMAPEQVDRRAPVDERADLYALGVLLYEAVTGELPWQGETALALAVARLLAPPPDPRARARVPDALAELVLALMARDPAERPANAHAVADRIAREVGEGAGRASMAPPDAAASVRPGALPVVAAPRRVRVAVLPIAAHEHLRELAAGLTQDLVDGLSSVPGVVVRSQATGLRAEADPVRLGRELGVELVVSGALLRLDGDRYRLTLRATTVCDGVQLWARRFEGDASAWIATIDEAARAIGAALSVEAPVARRAAPDAQSIELYLQARSKFRQFTQRTVEEAIALLEVAVRRSPDSALILAALASASARRHFWTGLGEDEARSAALRALEVDPSSAEGHAALAAVEFQSGCYDAALDALDEALVRAPLSADAHFLRARLLFEIDEPAHALAGFRRTVDLDPGIWLAHYERARLHALEGAWFEAELALDTTVALAPSDEITAMRLNQRLRFALWRGEPEPLAAALGDIDALSASGLPVRMLAGARMLAEAVRTRTRFDADGAMRAISGERGSPRRVVFFEQLEAEVAGFHGFHDLCIEATQRAIASGLIDLAWIRRCPSLAAVRATGALAPIEAQVAARVEPARAKLVARAR
jgi:serine/threonine-protein kinase